MTNLLEDGYSPDSENNSWLKRHEREIEVERLKELGYSQMAAHQLVGLSFEYVTDAIAKMRQDGISEAEILEVTYLKTSDLELLAKNTGRTL